ncbi:MAG: hypothetical protein ABEK36_04615 [Candidatus Aenigmatarchaeota archaeon]
MLEIPANATDPNVPETVKPIFVQGYKDGFTEGFKYAVGAVQNLIFMIVILCAIYWIIRFIINRKEIDTSISCGDRTIEINNYTLHQWLAGTFYTMILLTVGFLSFWTVV